MVAALPPPSLTASSEGKAVVWAHAKCLPLLSPLLPLPLHPRPGLACLQPTVVLATPVITIRVAAAEEAAVVERVLYASSPHGRKGGRKGRTYCERMTSAFVGEEDNGDRRQMPQAERREDEWSPRLKFATATAKVYLSPPRCTE